MQQNENRVLKIVRISSDVSYGALIDADDKEIEITDDMILRACEIMENDQVYPFTRIASS